MKAILDSIKATVFTLDKDEVKEVLKKYSGVTITAQSADDIADDIVKLCAPENIICEMDVDSAEDIKGYIKYGDYYHPDRKNDDTCENLKIFWDHPLQSFSALLTHVLDVLPDDACDKIVNDLDIQKRSLSYWVQRPSKAFVSKKTEEIPEQNNNEILDPKSEWKFLSEPVTPSLSKVVRICFSLGLSPETSLKLIQLSGNGDLVYASTERIRLAIYLVTHCTAIPWDTCFKFLTEKKIL